MTYNAVMDTINVCGLGNTLNGWITMFSVDRNTKVKILPEYIYGRMYEILDSRHLFFGDFVHDRNINGYWATHFLVLKSETEQKDTGTIPKCWRTLTLNPNLDSIFNNDVHIGVCFNPDLICDTVKRRYLSAIDDIVWSYPVREAINQISVKEKSLAVSVRTWKASHEKDVLYPYIFEDYRDTIVKTINDNGLTHVYFSVDNEEYKQSYLDLFHTLGIEYTELNKVYENMTKSQSTILKAMHLGRCDYFIGNGSSTFSSLVFWFSKLKIKVIDILKLSLDS
jgi:hypothetical protein